MILARTKIILCFAGLSLFGCSNKDSLEIELPVKANIAIIGNNLCSRMMEFNHFETHMQLANPDRKLTIRNLCDPGNTPGFRPHSSRPSPWAFEGAESYFEQLAQPSGSIGQYKSPDEWLTEIKPNLILAFFGYNEAFERINDIENFKGELDKLIVHTKNQPYNTPDSSILVICSPIPLEIKNLNPFVDNPKEKNDQLLRITEAMAETCLANNIPFIDLFHFFSTKYAFQENYTDDGFQLNNYGYKILAEYLTQIIFGSKINIDNKYTSVRKAIEDKNWFWHNLYKTPNGVHVHGRRYEPYGPDNYPAELTKLKQLTEIRDSAIWATIGGENIDIDLADQNTLLLPDVETNYNPPGSQEQLRYLYGEEALKRFTLASGYKIELFASEEDFPDLANPVQLSFDNKNRLWVSVMPSYPHYKPGDSKPNDKILILEDTNNDGKADKQIVWADSLHLPIGFEIAAEGVYVSQAPHLKLLIDSDGDDKADTEKILLSGFDDHDTHHAISAFTADPSGAIYMCEGVFLHTNVETAYGPIRGTNGGFYRYSPQKNELQRIAQLKIPNPWGVAIDQWGQPFFQETSGPQVFWMTPGQVKPRYGYSMKPIFSVIEQQHRVRPTSGIEFISSSHFPEDVQGDLLFNNTIGFLGTKQHQIIDDTTGYIGKFRQDLFASSDPNFRPVDLEFAPDGSLYIVDWHNILIGHMQHNARDPLRDHSHGRIYRITYPERPLIKPFLIYGAEITELLENLKSKEYRTRYRIKRELRGRSSEEVILELNKWINTLEDNKPNTPFLKLEGLWVSWGAGKVHEDLLSELLKDPNYRIRAAATQVLRHNYSIIKNAKNLMLESAKDPHNRVRLEAIIAASWLPKEDGLNILAEASNHTLDRWMSTSYRTSFAHLNNTTLSAIETEETVDNLKGKDYEQYIKGKEIYNREGFCGNCHQRDGLGLKGIYPTLSDTEWVTGNPDNLIKITLHGLYGPMQVNGDTLSGLVPMTAFKKMLTDEEIASVLTYIRNTFGNEEEPVSAEQVSKVRASTAEKEGFYTVEELVGKKQNN